MVYSSEHTAMRLVFAIALVMLIGCTDQTSVDANTTTEQSSQPAKDIAEHKEPAIAVRIDALPDSVAIPAESKVYVFLRPRGERMPLGVEQLKPQQLPMDVMFSYPESESVEFEVVARVSLSGKVNRGEGDLERVERVSLDPNVTQQVTISFSGNERASGGLPPGHPPIHQSVDKAKIVPLEITLAEDIAPSTDAAVFVIARDAGTTGLPLAVRRLALSELPKLVKLSDADAMLSMHRISRRNNFEVLARLSMTGSASSAPGDFESEVVTFKWSDSSETPIQLKIEREL